MFAMQAWELSPMPSTHVKAGQGNMCVTQHTGEMTWETPGTATQSVSSRLSERPCLLSTKKNNWGGPPVSVSSFHMHTLTHVHTQKTKQKQTDIDGTVTDRKQGRKEWRISMLGASFLLWVVGQKGLVGPPKQQRLWLLLSIALGN